MKKLLVLICLSLIAFSSCNQLDKKQTTLEPTRGDKGQVPVTL